MKSLLNKLRSIFNHPLIHSSINPPTTKSWASAWLAGREDTLAPYSALTSAYQQSSWVYACITTLAESVSAIPFRFIDAKNAEPQTANPELERLFQQPHPQLDRFQFWELIVIWLCLRGEAFIYPIESSSSSSSSSSASPSPRWGEGRGEVSSRASRSSVQSLLILCPDHLHEIIRNGELIGWRYTAPSSICHSPSSPAVFLPEDLIHIKTPNPFNFFRGLSPLTIAWLSAQTDYAAAQFMKGLMFNNADTGLIVTTDAQLSPEQREVIEAALRNRKRSAGTPDKPVFLGGGVKIEKPSISAVDLQFLENRKFNRQEICAIFKVPQELIGFTEDANRSVSESMRLNFMENRVAPLCRRLESAIQPLIDRLSSGSTARAASGLRAHFHIAATPIMQSAQRARFETATKLFSMGIPLNIINKNLDLGLPKLPHGDKVYLPTKLQEVGPSHLGEGPQRALEPHQDSDPAERCLRLLPLLNLTSSVAADVSPRPVANGKPISRF